MAAADGLVVYVCGCGAVTSVSWPEAGTSFEARWPVEAAA